MTNEEQDLIKQNTKKGLVPDHVKTGSGQGYKVAAADLDCLIPIYSEYHTLCKRQLQDPWRYDPTNPELIDVINNLDATSVQRVPGEVRAAGTWGDHGAPCPACLRMGRTDKAARACFALEIVTGNRRYTAIKLVNDRRREVSAGQTLLQYTFIYRGGMTDAAAISAMSTENNIRVGNTPIEQIRQAVHRYNEDPTQESEIRVCFSTHDFGRKVDPLNVARVMSLCHPDIWEAYAKKKVTLAQAETLSTTNRPLQQAKLQDLLASDKAGRKPPRPRLSSGARDTIIKWLEQQDNPDLRAALEELQKGAG